MRAGRASSLSLKRASLIQLVDIFRYGRSLAHQIMFHCLRKLRMRKPMGGARSNGQKAARQFMFAARTAFKRLDLVRDAVLDGLVVASLEMQSRVEFKRPP